MMKCNNASQSYNLYQRGQAVLPNGNTRHSVFYAPFPVYAAKASGAYVTDVDGVSRLDCVNNYSSLLHGHNHPSIIGSVSRQLEKLVAVGQPTEWEVKLGELLCDRIESVEKVRFTNSGSEAIMLAIKAARAHTGRPKVAKFEGSYHGIYEGAEISQAPTADRWGPPDRPSSVPMTRGTPQSIADETLILPFNDVTNTMSLLEAHQDDLAAVIVDPAPSHMKYLEISDEQLSSIIRFCRRRSVLLIFDEVYSLRLGIGGMQGKLGVRPDLTVMGKIIGGGFPVGAVGGRDEVMSVFNFDAQERFVPHGGTYNANPISLAAGYASMKLTTVDVLNELDRMGDFARKIIREAVVASDWKAEVIGSGSLISITLGAEKVNNYRDIKAQESSPEIRAAFHLGLLERGVMIAPYGLWVLSSVMCDEDVKKIGDMTFEVLMKMKDLDNFNHVRSA